MSKKYECVAEGCTNKPCKDLEFFDFPDDKDQLQCWVDALKKPADFKPSDLTKVCSVHFVNRQVSPHPWHPDYSPSVFRRLRSKKRDKGSRARQIINAELGLIEPEPRERPQKTLEEILLNSAETKTYIAETSPKRRNEEDEVEERKRAKCISIGESDAEWLGEEMITTRVEDRGTPCSTELTVNSSISDVIDSVVVDTPSIPIVAKRGGRGRGRGRPRRGGAKSLINDTLHWEAGTAAPHFGKECSTCQVYIQEIALLKEELREKKAIASEWDNIMDNFSRMMQSKLSVAETQVKDLQKRVSVLELSEEFFQKKKHRVVMYTGLPSYSVLMNLYDLVRAAVKEDLKIISVTPFQKFLMVLMKLRMNMKFKDLSHRFNVDLNKIERFFPEWMTAFHKQLSHVLVWPKDNVNYRLDVLCTTLKDHYKIIKTDVSISKFLTSEGLLKSHHKIETVCASLCHIAEVATSEVKDQLPEVLLNKTAIVEDYLKFIGKYKEPIPSTENEQKHTEVIKVEEESELEKSYSQDEEEKMDVDEAPKKENESSETNIAATSESAGKIEKDPLNTEETIDADGSEKIESKEILKDDSASEPKMDDLTKSATEDASKSTTDDSSKSSTDDSSKIKTDVASKSTTDDSSKSSTDDSLKTTTDDASKSTTEDASDSATDDASKITTDDASKSTSDEDSKSATDDASKSATDDACKSTTDDACKSTTDDATKSTTDDASKSTTDDASKSTTDDASKSTTDDASKSATDDASKSATDDASKSTSDDASKSTSDEVQEKAENKIEIDVQPEAAIKLQTEETKAEDNPQEEVSINSNVDGVSSDVQPMEVATSSEVDVPAMINNLTSTANVTASQDADAIPDIPSVAADLISELMNVANDATFTGTDPSMQATMLEVASALSAPPASDDPIAVEISVEDLEKLHLECQSVHEEIEEQCEVLSQHLHYNTQLSTVDKFLALTELPAKLNEELVVKKEVISPSLQCWLTLVQLVTGVDAQSLAYTHNIDCELVKKVFDNWVRLFTIELGECEVPQAKAEMKRFACLNKADNIKELYPACKMIMSKVREESSPHSWYCGMTFSHVWSLVGSSLSGYQLQKELNNELRLVQSLCVQRQYIDQNILKTAPEHLVLHYTGFPDYDSLFDTFSELLPGFSVAPSKSGNLSDFSQFLCVLLRLVRDMSDSEILLHISSRESEDTMESILNKREPDLNTIIPLWLRHIHSKFMLLVSWPVTEKEAKLFNQTLRDRFRYLHSVPKQLLLQAEAVCAALYNVSHHLYCITSEEEEEWADQNDLVDWMF